MRYRGVIRATREATAGLPPAAFATAPSGGPPVVWTPVRHLTFTRSGLTVAVQTFRPGSGVRPAPADEERPPIRAGSLEIQERRTWATWQLAICALVFVIIGMMIGYSGKKAPKSVDATAGRPKFTPNTAFSPPTTSQSGSSGGTSFPNGISTQTTFGSTGTTVASSGLSGQQSQTSTTVAHSSTTVSAAAACNNPTGTLMPNTTGKGPEGFPAITTTRSWCIGWAFSCVGAPGGSGPFTINVTTGSSTTTAVQQAGRTTKGEVPESATGSVRLAISTDPACIWAVKVTSG